MNFFRDMQQRTQNAKDLALHELQKGKCDLETAMKLIRNRDVELQSLKEALYDYQRIFSQQRPQDLNQFQGVDNF